MPTRILFCSSYIDNTSTGSAVFARIFLDWAEARSIKVDIISSEKSSNEERISLVKQNKIFTKIPIVDNYHRSFIYYKTVKEQIKKNSYDLIFFNSVTESLHTAKLINSCPVVGFLHDENFLNDYQESASLKRRTYRKFMHRHEKSACHFLDKILTNSKYMKSQIETIYTIHPLKVSFHYFGATDLPEYNRKTSSKSDSEELKILFIKHDYIRGGLKLLSEACSMLQNKTKLTIVGPPAKVHTKIKKWFPDNIDVEIIEQCNRAEIFSHFKACDLFCVPSHSEALGLANFEAMHFGKTVVSQEIPVMRELNSTRQCMTLAERNSAQDLALKIESITSNNEAQIAQQSQADKFIKAELNIEKLYNYLDKCLDF